MNQRCLWQVILHFGLVFPEGEEPWRYVAPVSVKRLPACPFSPLWLLHTQLIDRQKRPALFWSLLSVDGNLLLLKRSLWSHLSDSFFIKYGTSKSSFMTAIWQEKNCLFLHLYNINFPKQVEVVLKYYSNFAVVLSVVLYSEGLKKH